MNTAELQDESLGVAGRGYPRVTATDLEPWAETAGGRVTPISLSENAVFRVDGRDGTRFVLRLHRPGYNDPAAIDSELAWIWALYREGLPVPQAIAGRDGRLVQRSAGRQAVLWTFIGGSEPQLGNDLLPLFRRLGTLAARMHRSSTSFVRPDGFTRPRWDADVVLGGAGPWGDWRQAPGVGAVRAKLESAEARLREELEGYGKGADRFGLIHADMRLANLLVDGSDITVIDFDDCGEGWFAYDFAAAVSFFETDRRVPALKAAWVDGYRGVRALDGADLRALDSCVLLRRLALLAWIGSHGETELAQAHADHFAAGTAELAERYLGSA